MAGSGGPIEGIPSDLLSLRGTRPLIRKEGENG